MYHDIRPAPPLPSSILDGESLCPECEHEGTDPFSSDDAIQRWINRQWGRIFPSLRPATTCQWRFEVMTDTCECDHPYHR